MRDFIEREQLYGLGWGLVDMILLASALLTPGASLWTLVDMRERHLENQMLGLAA